MKKNGGGKILWFWLLSFMVVSILSSVLSYPFTPCPNMCSKHGTCKYPYGVCECHTGYTGADCSLRTCPTGLHAWTDHASADDTAHAAGIECSNRGNCDRVLGHCNCQDGFEGVACERKKCPGNHCNGKGRCVSAHILARMQDPGELRKQDGCTSLQICQDGSCTQKDYSVCFQTLDYTQPWDADMFYGCICDKGYEGYDCSQRTCPRGDDPLTGSPLSAQLQYNEIQLLECKATFGTFTLTFMGHTTAPISADATVAEFTEALSKLDSLKQSGSGNKIQVQWLSSATTVCTSDGNDIQITFLQNFGDLPLIIPNGSNLGHIDASEVPLVTNQKLITGDKESDECSNRGTCTHSSGMCYCLEDWTTSDGMGGPGSRGDCGYRSEGTTSTCPGEPACLGFGTCSGPPEYRCDCQDGRFGPDCALINCPKGKSWFSYPLSNDVAHTLAECSDMGTCDTNTGVCDCGEGFTGSACEFMKCPGSPIECYGNGQCLSMAALAEANSVNGVPNPVQYGVDPNNHLTWDYEQVRGCLCSDGWEGYDCSLRSCPKGDDPQRQNQHNEIQQIFCQEIATFHLVFRGQQTILLQADDTIQELENALNNLLSIEKVLITYNDPSIYIGAPGLDADALHLCRTSGQTIKIEFLSPTGDVPLITVLDQLGHDFNGNIAITEFTKGTKEFATCSNRGICNHEFGLCECFAGFASSDGQGNAGSLGDCGYKSPVPVSGYNGSP